MRHCAQLPCQWGENVEEKGMRDGGTRQRRAGQGTGNRPTRNDRHWSFVIGHLAKGREQATGNRKRARGGQARGLSLAARGSSLVASWIQGARELPKRQTAADGRESGTVKSIADCGVKGKKPKTGVGPEHFGPPVSAVYPPVLVAGWVMGCSRPAREDRRAGPPEAGKPGLLPVRCRPWPGWQSGLHRCIDRTPNVPHLELSRYLNRKKNGVSPEKTVARKDLLCAALPVSLTDAISLEDGGVGVYAALSGNSRGAHYGCKEAVLEGEVRGQEVCRRAPGASEVPCRRQEAPRQDRRSRPSPPGRYP